MSKQLTFTNGLLTNVSGSETSGSAIGGRKYTFTNGVLTSVGNFIPGAIKSIGNFTFINGLMVNPIITGSSGSYVPPPPPIGNYYYIQLADNVNSYADLTNDASMADLGEKEFTMEGWFRFDVERNLYENIFTIPYMKQNQNATRRGGWQLILPYNYAISYFFLQIWYEYPPYNYVYYKEYQFQGIDLNILYGNWIYLTITSKTITTFTTINYADFWINGEKQTASATPIYYVGRDAGDDSAYHLLIGKKAGTGSRTFDLGWQRLSNYVRYTSNFTPIAKETPPNSDSGTIGLWKIDEGSGTSVSSPTGTLYNGSWVGY